MSKLRFSLGVMALLYAATTLSVSILAVWLWHRAHPELTGGQLVAWSASKWWAWALAIALGAAGLWLVRSDGTDSSGTRSRSSISATETKLQEALLLVEDVLSSVIVAEEGRALFDTLLVCGRERGSASATSAEWWCLRATALGRGLGHLRDTSTCRKCGHAKPAFDAVCAFCGVNS